MCFGVLVYLTRHVVDAARACGPIRRRRGDGAGPLRRRRGPSLVAPRRSKEEIVGVLHEVCEKERLTLPDELAARIAKSSVAI